MTQPPTTNTALTQYRLHHSSLYDPAYCQEILLYFINATVTVMQKYEEGFEEEQGAKGTTRKVKGTNRVVVGNIPTFENFANSVGVTAGTLRDWAVKHPDFGYSCERCREVRKAFLIQASACGAIPPATAIFLMKSLTDLRDETSVVLTVAAPPEKPEFADYTPAQLQELREAVTKANALGITLMIKEPEGAEASRTSESASN